MNSSSISRKSIGTRIRLARISANLSQESVAKELNISQQAYAIFEKTDYDKIHGKE